MARIVVFLGSTRKGRQGIHVSKWTQKTLEQRGHDATVIDPLEHEELLYLSEMAKSQENPSEDMQEIRELIKSADGYVAITPEYNHSYSGALKNMLDHFLEEYAFKPCAIITYSAGNFGGIRAAEALRPVLSELGMVSNPISLAISKVQNTFSENGLEDEAYEKRIGRMLDEFEWYVDALKQKRESGTPY